MKGGMTMNMITISSRITDHFKGAEFRCKCGCNKIRIDQMFVERLESLHTVLRSLPCGCNSIIVTSGYRCDNHSKAIAGAFVGDMHNLGAAADIVAYGDQGKQIDSTTICEAAQKCGFGGIAIIDNTAAHVDDRQRDDIQYSNKQWYGNESTGQNVMTFKGKSKYTNQIWQKANQKYFEILIDDHRYSGFLDGE